MKDALTPEEGLRWRKRAMDLDCKLGWIRTELRMSNHLSLTTEWARGALRMLEETENEFGAFLKSVHY